MDAFQCNEFFLFFLIQIFYRCNFSIIKCPAFKAALFAKCSLAQIEKKTSPDDLEATLASLQEFYKNYEPLIIIKNKTLHVEIFVAQC